MLEVLQLHYQCLRQCLARFQGQEISTAGDSFFVVFSKPSDAVRFALDFQTRSPGLDNQVLLRHRIGIHVGEVFLFGEKQDYHGVEVDTCARVMSLGRGGQILITRSAFDSARQVLRGEDLAGLGELDWLNHGPYKLKGLGESIEICEVGEKGTAPLAPPPGGLDAAPASNADEYIQGWRPAPGQIVGTTNWRLIRKLGEGGFGEVWLAEHSKLKQSRVFKFCFKADRIRYLQREVTLFRVLSQASGVHPNLVGIHEVNLDQPPFYLVMDYAEGADLGAWVQNSGGLEAIPLTSRLEIVAQTAEALDAAHAKGVLHRDVKPSNIIVSGTLEKPSVKVTDFGIGQITSAEVLAGVTAAGLTQTLLNVSSSSQTGSHLYLAPELLTGSPANSQSDLYSLGVVLYQLTVGDLTRPMSTEWRREIKNPLLEQDIEKCIAPNPQDRWASAGLLVERLRNYPAREKALQEHKAALASLDLLRTYSAVSERRNWAYLWLRTIAFCGTMLFLAWLVLHMSFNSTSLLVVSRETRLRQEAWENEKEIALVSRIGKDPELIKLYQDFMTPMRYYVLGVLLTHESRFAEALVAFRKVAENNAESISLRSDISRHALMAQAKILRDLGRLDEALPLNLKANSISPRKFSTPSQCLDLSLYYNGNLNHDWINGTKHRGPFATLTSLVPNSTSLPFDFRGTIQLGVPADYYFLNFPASIASIPVRRSAQVIHFIHGTAFTETNGVKTGAYLLHRADGRKTEIPLIFGENITRAIPALSHAVPINSPRFEMNNDQNASLYHFSWTNPAPAISIDSFDFVGGPAAPFLVAVTLEP